MMKNMTTILKLTTRIETTRRTTITTATHRIFRIKLKPKQKSQKKMKNPKATRMLRMTSSKINCNYKKAVPFHSFTRETVPFYI